MKKNLAMEKKIVELSSLAEESRARERRLELQFAGLKAQFDALLASGGISPCSGDVTFPPRPPQSQPTQYPMYGQQRNMTHESSDEETDEESDDYVGRNLYAYVLTYFLAPAVPVIPDTHFAAGEGLGLATVYQQYSSKNHHFVAVEFDIFWNSYDPRDNHVGIDINSMQFVVNVTWFSGTPNCTRTDTWITYNSI
nr:uncharacterized protein LOC112942282 [Solanum lycopersicum]